MDFDDLNLDLVAVQKGERREEQRGLCLAVARHHLRVLLQISDTPIQLDNSSVRYLFSLLPSSWTDSSMCSRIATFVAIVIVAFVGSADAFVVGGGNSGGGLTALSMTKLNYNGKSVEVKEGTPLKNAVSKLGYKPKYSCKKGDCGSCTVSIGGSRIKACVGKVPAAPRLKSVQEKGLDLR